jgi:hypothetical protein
LLQFIGTERQGITATITTIKQAFTDISEEEAITLFDADSRRLERLSLIMFIRAVEIGIWTMDDAADIFVYMNRMGTTIMNHASAVLKSAVREAVNLRVPLTRRRVIWTDIFCMMSIVILQVSVHSDSDLNV